MYAIFAMRKMQITQRINQIQYELMQVSQKLQDLSLFGANISDGMITPDEAMNAPGGALFGEMFAAANMCYNQAVPVAQGRMQMYVQQQQVMAANSMVSPEQLQANNQFVFARILKSTMEQVARGFQKRIAVEENRIQMMKIKKESELKLLQSELDALDKAEDNGIKQSTPRYC